MAKEQTHACIAPHTGAGQSRLASTATHAAILAWMAGGNGTVLRTVRSTNALMHSQIAASLPRGALTMKKR